MRRCGETLGNIAAMSTDVQPFLRFSRRLSFWSWFIVSPLVQSLVLLQINQAVRSSLPLNERPAVYRPFSLDTLDQWGKRLPMRRLNPFPFRISRI